jgi:hypothetical protein
MTDFLRTFHEMEKSALAGGWGVHAHLILLYLPSLYEVRSSWWMLVHWYTMASHTVFMGYNITWFCLGCFLWFVFISKIQYGFRVFSPSFFSESLPIWSELGFLWESVPLLHCSHRKKPSGLVFECFSNLTPEAEFMNVQFLWGFCA